MAPHQALCAQTTLNGDGKLRTYSTYGDQSLENPLGFASEKAVQRKRIFAHVGMDKESHLGTLGRQLTKGRHADHYVVTNSAGLDDRLLWMFLPGVARAGCAIMR